MAQPITAFPSAHTVAVSAAERAARRARVQAELTAHGLDGMVFFRALAIRYLTGFDFIPTERPFAYMLKTDGSSALLVPRLEQEHAEHRAAADRIVAYPEYPGEVHPMRHLADLLTDHRLAEAALAADSDGYGSYWGYAGPRLSEVLPAARLTLLPGLIERLRAIKSAGEIRLIQESCRWGHLAHKLLQTYSKPGAAEMEIAARASHEATLAMLQTLGPAFRPGGMGGAGAHAGFRGQIGKNSFLPHAVTSNATLKEGDVLVTGAAANVDGYLSELERTMFVGHPSDKQRHFFELMCECQEAAFEAIKPGIACAEVDRAVRRFFDRHKLWDHWRHHVGHALGMEGHEAPFFDLGDETLIEPGMVFSVEPGIYVEGLGGFRHSDTVLVTGTGIELLTYYPRELDAMICT